MGFADPAGTKENKALGKLLSESLVLSLPAGHSAALIPDGPLRIYRRPLRSTSLTCTGVLPSYAFMSPDGTFYARFDALERGTHSA